jgi:hypothetical protein
MKTSTHKLEPCLSLLYEAARKHGLNDTAWAKRAGIRKETLSRIRSRNSADYNTLQALAQAVGARIDVLHEKPPATTDDGHFPSKVHRDYEERLLQLANADNHEVNQWLKHGPAFFMAGFAVMLASLRGKDRYALLSLAEQLHPGSSVPEVFAIWLQRAPLQVSRVASMLNERLRHAA